MGTNFCYVFVSSIGMTDLPCCEGGIEIHFRVVTLPSSRFQMNVLVRQMRQVNGSSLFIDLVSATEIEGQKIT
jgi:hypothetical protein